VIDLLAGAVTGCFVLSALFFLRFWRKTADRLYLAFAAAFSLLAIGQALGQWLNAVNEPAASGVYAIRVLGFLLIIGALLEERFDERK
jgi:hypothetical protein